MDCCLPNLGATETVLYSLALKKSGRYQSLRIVHSERVAPTLPFRFDQTGPFQQPHQLLLLVQRQVRVSLNTAMMADKPAAGALGVFLLGATHQVGQQHSRFRLENSE